jgi:hypothetical protein
MKRKTRVLQCSGWKHHISVLEKIERVVRRNEARLTFSTHLDSFHNSLIPRLGSGSFPGCGAVTKIASFHIQVAVPLVAVVQFVP